MRKLYLLITCAILCTCFTISCKVIKNNEAPVMVSQTGEKEEQDEDDRYDGPGQRDSLEFLQTKDPALGYVPYNRLKQALDYTQSLENNALANSRISSTILWQERGPIYDSVGPSNGNGRGGGGGVTGGYTSGRIAAVLIDTLNDPTGNTVIVGGISGGVWKCTNFLTSAPNWRIINDYFNNLAISSFCQDPTNPSIIYFSTGEATSNADAHFGAGIWKSTDKGETFNQLASTVNFIRNFKLLCDAAGNVYDAARITTTPLAQPNGLMRSNDKGATWTNITPANLTSTNAHCTDIEISSTGKLHASFGYNAAGGIIINHRFTSTPATVTTAAGWNISTGIKQTATCVRLELACLADTLYGVTCNNAGNSDSCYKSIDGGATWTKQNTTVMPAGVLSGQGWYNETLAINPANSSEVMCGGLDAYRSTNSGSTWVRTTFWVSTPPYVHADHHFMQWWKTSTESRMVIGCDGGIFFSRDNGVNWSDRNRNLALKQFYAGAIHPAAGSPYLLAGAQDNGNHNLRNPGLSYSTEVVGGDGFYTYINQIDPNIQYGSYVYNTYRRSVDGGNTWGTVTLNGNAGFGLFSNPYDYDDGQNILYACYSANTYLRWPNANTGTTFTSVPVPQLGGQAGAVRKSPNTANRIYLGGTSGKLIRVDNANAATPTITDITGASFPAGGYINCVNMGSTDNTLVACFTNFGVNNVWTSTDGGVTWNAIDGNLPDMPVRWALYDPTNNNRLIIATETGVWTTDNINGASTVWTPDPSIPLTRISMLRIRASDRTVVAATYGRGLFTGVLSNTTSPEVTFVAPSTTVKEQTAATTGCRSYKDYTVGIGITNAPTGDATVTINVQAGTATRGVDYDFTTNGDFSNPSSQLVFTNGVLGTKFITVRIYDDVEVEPTEFFTLGFVISGTTNAVAGVIQTYNVTIQDNDAYPVIPYTLATLGTYNSDITGGVSPFNGTVLKHRLQVLYTAAELQASGISASAPISSLTLRVITKNTTLPFKGFTISLGSTNNVNVAAGFVPEGLTQVYSADYSTVVGNNVFNFSTSFIWDGISNIAVQFCWDNTGSTVEGVADVVEGNAAPLGATVRASTYSNYTTGSLSGCGLAAALVNFTRINATFGIGIKVATALNATKTEYLGDRSDLFYYAPTGELLARVLNLSSQTYGCTQVLIDRAGTGVSQFWNTNPANYLMNKTYQIVPTTNSSTGKYEVTFYFTAAEKAGWEAATGKSWDSIQIIKVPSRISNVTPAIAQPDGPGTVQVINAVKRTFGPNYYTLSAIFESGFSGFGFGVPGRMNTLLTLTGVIDANNVDIDLTWTTSAEINSTVFEVEKSYDNVTFHKIGTVPAAGNKLSPSSYPFVDHENVQNNYYRIKMLHSDGYVLYSNTIFIKKDGPQHIFVLNNPFTNQINIRFGQTPTGPIVFSLYDAVGKLVKRYEATAGSVQYTINTTDIVSKAFYMLKINVGGAQIFSTKVMKQ